MYYVLGFFVWLVLSLLIGTLIGKLIKGPPTNEP